MTAKRKTILGRAARTIIATGAGLLAAYLAGPHGMDWIKDPQLQSFVIMVVTPMLITIDKAMRWGSDAGEE